MVWQMTSSENRATKIPFIAADSGLQRAIEAVGCEHKLAAAINVPAKVLSWWLRNQGSPVAYACIRIEDCTGIRCPDLHWLRLGDEVVGHIVPVDGASSAYVEGALRVARSADANKLKCAMVDGMLYGLDEARRLELLEFYRVDEPSVDVDLESLLHDIYFDRQDAAYFQAWGITYALDDHIREDLMRRYAVFQGAKAAADGELGRLQDEVDALRRMAGAGGFRGALDPRHP
jgi:hypothetical protein